MKHPERKLIYGGSLVYDKDQWDRGNTNKYEIKEWLFQNVGTPWICSDNEIVDFLWDDTLTYPRAHTISQNFFFKNSSDALLFNLRWI